MTALQKFQTLTEEIEQAKRNVGGSLNLNEGWHGLSAASYLETEMPQASTAHLEFLNDYVVKVTQAHKMHNEYRLKRMKALVWEARVVVEIELENKKRTDNLIAEGGIRRLQPKQGEGQRQRRQRLGAGGAFDAPTLLD